MSTTQPTIHPWPNFPHYPSCSRRLWTKTPRRPRDPRGQVTPPTPTGHCPHCGTALNGRKERI